MGRLAWYSVGIGTETMLEITPDGFIELNMAALGSSPYVRFLKD